MWEWNYNDQYKGLFTFLDKFECEFKCTDFNK